IPFSLILGYVIAGVDIRQHGSGNIGATNLARVAGWRYFPIALLLDFAKGAIPMFAWSWRAQSAATEIATARALSLGDSTFLNSCDFAALVGLAALVGHLWPIYLRFRGGKGVATGAGVVSVLMPVPTLFAALAWGILVAITRYVSLSSLGAALTLVLAQIAYTWPRTLSPSHRAATLLAVAGAVLVVVRHRDNIVRLWQGRESKIGQPARTSHPDYPPDPKGQPCDASRPPSSGANIYDQSHRPT
ncbi:MAG: glycerol-3-phosphate 1-O-acyltransferase PlsY, partial [Gemmatales bacterium]|nr:glycerol-3-phosphate 1-O-acyltransferase PlsY [Gemmatales bacterium]MDW8174242.1 glycerol-3-phosphate 1-O-acyltransferase PlsY [Gemmatales bacterium]